MIDLCIHCANLLYLASFLARYPFRPSIDSVPDTRCVVSVDILRRYWRVLGER